MCWYISQWPLSALRYASPISKQRSHPSTASESTDLHQQSRIHHVPERGLSRRDIPNTYTYYYTTPMLFFLSFSGDDDALLIFLFSLVLFSPSIELEKRYSRAGQQSRRPSQIYTSCAKKQSTTTTQHQKALYLRESMEIYIYILCVCSESALFCLCPVSLSILNHCWDPGGLHLRDRCWTVYCTTPLYLYTAGL